MKAASPQRITVAHGGRTYLWTGKVWVDLKSFVTSETALEPTLRKLASETYGDGWQEVVAPAGAKTKRAAPAAKGKPKPAVLPGVEITPEYREVLALLEAGTPVVLATGVAGTGKSTLIQVVREQAGKRAVVVAPTGVAALNAGGVTIHSFFRFPPRLVNLADIAAADERTIFEKLELLIVDEVSMVRADVLDGIDRSLRVNRRVPRLPFGGVQVLLVGDLLQLPPVVSRDEKEIFRGSRYESPHFFSGRIFREVRPVAVELTKVFRQEAGDFVELLNAVRSGTDPRGTVSRLNAACLREPWAGDNHLTLTATNDVADALNAARLAALPGEARVYRGQVEGRMERESEKLPAPLDLALKEGARVMFTRNDEDRRWVNGTFGIVRDLGADTVHVEIPAAGGAATHAVGPAVWEAYRYRYDRAADRIEAEVVGSYQQIPLMPAWAVTIHKSQGKTLERVLVDLGRGAFAPGQVYVALSRCRALEDVLLARPLQPQDIRVDPQVKDFWERLLLVRRGREA